MRHLKNIALACCMLAFVCATPALAADESALKYGVVDMSKVIKEAEAAKGIFNELEGRRKEYQTQIKKEEDTLGAAEKEILKLKQKLSKEEFEKKAREFETKIVNAQKGVQERKKTLDAAYGSSMHKLRGEAAKIISEIAKERGYSAVFTQEAVIMASESLDMTEEVIVRLNKSVKKIPVEWAEKKK